MPKSGNLRVLFVTTWAFTVCFAVWTMFGVTGIPIRTQLNLNSTQLGLLTATPVLTGALFRLPLGIWTDRFGGRVIMLLLLVGCAVPLWISSYATALWQFLLLGLALGLVGASFSVGTPYVARFFPKESRGFAMGFFGAGTTGAALNMFVAPLLIGRYGWQSVPKVYAVALLVTAALFWFLSAPDPGQARAVRASMRQQLAVLRDPRVWKYCQYYSIVFGGFTALSVWMPQYFKSEYGFSIAQASLLAACFSLPGGAFRAVGGWLSDRYRRSQCDLVGAVGGLDRPVPALLPENRSDRAHRQWAGQFRYRAAALALHRLADGPRCRLRLRHGVDLQIRRRRLSRTAWAPSPASSAWPAASAGSCCRSCSARSWIGSA